MIVGTLELKLSAETLLALDAHTKALERLAVAVEAKALPAASSPAEPPLQSLPIAPPRWPSPERDAVIVRMRAEGSPWRDIFWAVCELPGARPPSLDAVKTYCRDRLGAPRPAETYSEHDKARMANLAAKRKEPAVVPVSVPSPLPWDTPERIALLRRLYPTDMAFPQIVAEMAQLPGGEMPPADSIRTFAIQKLGLHRPVRPLLEPRPPAPEPAAPQPVSRADALARVSASVGHRGVLADPGGPVEADFEQVRSFAASKAIRFDAWDDLPAVNRWLEHRGLRTFKRKFPQRGAA